MQTTVWLPQGNGGRKVEAAKEGVNGDGRLDFR